MSLEQAIETATQLVLMVLLVDLVWQRPPMETNKANEEAKKASAGARNQSKRRAMRA